MNIDFNNIIPHLPGQHITRFRELRENAKNYFVNKGWPTRNDEDWRYSATAVKFNTDTLNLLKPTAVQELHIHDAGLSGPCLVFVNGFFAPQLSRFDEIQGITIKSLAEAIEEPRFMTHYAQQNNYEHNSLIALNTALSPDGIYIEIAKDVSLKQPLQLLSIHTTSAGSMIFPKHMLVLESGASACVVERFINEGESNSLVNRVMEINLGEHAALQHIQFIEQSDSSMHFGHVQVNQQASSEFISHQIVLNGNWVRNDISVHLNGEKSHCRLYGLMLQSDARHTDFHSTVMHHATNCQSYSQYKAVLNDRSKGVFNGKVIVEPHANDTVAQQQSKNLLLSKQAEMNTKPELQIYADKVQCSHGATVGQIDEDKIFYLRSRGIPSQVATFLLVHAFSLDIVNSLPANIKNFVAKQIETRMRNILKIEQALLGSNFYE